jgi:hypothetical protein
MGNLAARLSGPRWLWRIEMLSTTLIVAMIGSMMLWYESIEHERRLVVTIGSAIVLYVAGLVISSRRSDPGRISWWPFGLAGLIAGAIAELINAQFLVTRELLAAMVTGLVIGTAHWIALRVWLHFTGRDPPPEIS